MGFFEKIIFWFNSVVAFLLVVSFVLPYLSPKSFPTLSLLSLGVSPLILINIIFALFWMVRLKKQALISIIILTIASIHFNSFLEFSSEEDPQDYRNTLHILSYNVRLFNAYEKAPTEDAQAIISELLEQEQPDIFFIQEYYRNSTIEILDYPYSFIHFKNDKNKLGHAIFSKYPLINTGAFDFEDSYNNTLYADVVKGNDTIRLYNLHLQSLGIQPSVDYLQEENNDRLRKRLSQAFIKQQNQVSKIMKHKESSPYPVLLGGDFNNTPFSYVCRKVGNEMNDAFLEKGNGLGTTFLFDSYPMRIDYIFTSDKFDILKFNTIKKTFSDHYPISTTIGWN